VDKLAGNLRNRLAIYTEAARGPDDKLVAESFKVGFPILDTPNEDSWDSGSGEWIYANVVPGKDAIRGGVSSHSYIVVRIGKES